MARIGAIGEVLRSLDHRLEGRCKCLSATRSQQGHPCCFNEPLKVFQCRANGTTVPVFLLWTLQVTMLYDRKKKYIYIFLDVQFLPIIRERIFFLN